MGRIKDACLIFALAIMTAGTLSAASHGASTKSIPQLSNTNYAAVEGRTILAQIENRAQAVRDAIGMLNTQVRFADVDFETQSDALAQVRSDINAIGKDLQRLDDLQAQLEPWQKRELVRIQPLAAEMADATRAAIKTLKQNEDRTWATPMPDQMTTIVDKAEAIRNSVSESVQVAKLNKEIDLLGHKS